MKWFRPVSQFIVVFPSALWKDVCKLGLCLVLGLRHHQPDGEGGQGAGDAMEEEEGVKAVQAGGQGDQLHQHEGRASPGGEE